MTPQQFLDHVAADSATFARHAAGALEQPIPHLDDWLVRDLVAHLGMVYSVVIANTSSPSAEPGDLDAPALPGGPAINDWFAERRTLLLTTLASANDEDVAWTFAGVKDVAWWKRRMASETAVHRWDVDAAANATADAIDSDLAADAVQEFLDVSLLHSSSRPGRVYPSQSLHLHRSDGPGEWMLATDEQNNVVVTHEHGKGDAAVRGSASDLVLWVWGRPAAGVEIFGDEAVANAWRALAP